MIVSHSRKFVFVHVHKAGGTSFAVGIDPFLAWDDIVIGGSQRGQAINEPYRRRFGLHKHSSVAEIERVCGRDLVERYFTFALVVRGPLDRMCSFYNFLGSLLNPWAAQNNVAIADIPAYAERHRGAKAPPFLAWPASVAFCASRSFSEFIRSDALARDVGSKPQIERLTSGDGEMRCHAFRLEDSAVWLPELRQRLGCDFAFPRENASRETLVAPANVAPDDKRHIESKYSADYAAFGY